MQEIVFAEKKDNHYYAKKDKGGRYELVDEPVKGERYFEFAAVSGG